MLLDPVRPDVAVARWLPAAAVAALARHVDLDAAAWDPAAGDGAIGRALGSTARVSDADPDLHGREVVDFLAEAEAWGGDIVTIPPAALTEAYATQALALTREARGRVCLLMRHDWDARSRRDGLLAAPSFALKLTLVDGRSRAPLAWFVWDWRHEGPPRLAWAA